MANRSTHAPKTPKSEVQILTARFVGNTTSTPTLPESTQQGGGEIVSIARADTGDFTLVFRHSYPQLEHASISVRGATAGLTGRFTAIDVAAKTAELTLEVGATPTDPATTDTVQILLVVRNTQRE